MMPGTANTLFEIIGGQEIGLKARDLEDNRQILESAGFKVPGGYVVANEVFWNFYGPYNIGDRTTEDEILDARESEEVYFANKRLLEVLTPGQPYAIRSSAMSERGGSGIYETTFFVPSGNEKEDHEQLFYLERIVYASEFSPKAKAWRKKHQAEIGMALLIQPIIGASVSDCFFPCLNGQAYTSYQGKARIRLVSGIAYDDAGMELFDFNEVPSLEEFQRILRVQEMFRSVHLIGKTIIPLNLTHSRGIVEANFAKQFPASLFDKLAALSQHGDFYIEWAIPSPDSDDIHVVQCCPYVDKPVSPQTATRAKDMIVATGTDIVNHGTKKARYLVYMTLAHHIKSGVGDLQVINEGLTDFILAIPQESFSLASSLSDQMDALSIATGRPPLYSPESSRALSYEHFSNAYGLIETQRKLNDLEMMNRHFLGLPSADHTGGNTGGQHFQNLCNREDILFLGTEFDPRPLFVKCDPYVYAEGLVIWQGDFTLVNDATTGVGTLSVDPTSIEPIVCDYSILWLDGISHDLRRLANDEVDDERQSMLYCVHYLLPSDPTTVIPNPFFIDPFVIGEDGKEKTIAHVERFIEEGATILPDGWSPKLEKYLRELLRHLKKWEPPTTQT